ncbi:hypothetical protein CEXT_326741 [Caerostris extrusa]|uniref:Uncharacterized protein n=1 Tax=Caerostris extrusa TaxID=172846 RepID=A0AAV4UN76_CAEEX|nr:hypothetical protein CEXT_326741 [Caerostris extrusa]
MTTAIPRINCTFRLKGYDSSPHAASHPIVNLMFRRYFRGFGCRTYFSSHYLATECKTPNDCKSFNLSGYIAVAVMRVNLIIYITPPKCVVDSSECILRKQ